MSTMTPGPESHAPDPSQPTPDPSPAPALAQQIQLAAADPQRQLGRYLILSELARGGMGVVYYGWDPAMQRLVAIKVLKPGPEVAPETIQRFLREAQAAAKLRHPGIVSVYETNTGSDTPYIVMEFVDGQTLDALLKQGLELREALGLLADVAQALHFAHQQHVVHRDVKPLNIIVNPAGQAVLTDFGLAKDLASDSHLTVAGQVMGTPSFMSPEQVEAVPGTIGPLADVYSLGAVLYQAICGHPPFQAKSRTVLFKKVLMDPPKPLRELKPEVPANLDALVLRCLEKEPAHRYPSAGALAEDLQRFLAGQPLALQPLAQPASQAPAPSAPPAGEAPATAPAPAPEPTPPPSRLPLALAAGALVATMAGAGWLLSPKDEAATQPNPSASAAVSRPTALVTLTHPPANLVTNEPELSLEGDVQSGTLQSVWIQGAEVPVEDGSFFAAVTLSPGTQQLTVRDRLQGNELASLSVTLDRDPPELSVTSPSDEDMLVSDQTLSVQGTVRDDHLKELRRADGEVLTVEEDGRFSVPVDLPKADGRHQVVLTAEDEAGNRTQATVTVVVDRTPPTVELTEPGAVVATPQVSVRGVVADAHPGRVWLNGEEVEVSPDGRFETTIDLQGESVQELRLEAEDALGQRSEALIHSIALDQSPPVITLEAPTEGHSTNDPVLRVRGRVEDLHLPDSLTVNGVEASLDASGLFEAEISLQEGANEISVECLDGAGNPAQTIRRTVTCDSTAPTIALPQDFPRVIVGQGPTLEIAGSLDEAGCAVQVNGKPADVSGRSFSFKLRLDKGRNRIEVAASDTAGNTARLVHDIFYSRSRPREFKTAWWQPTEKQRAYALETDQPLWFKDDLGIRFVLIPPGEFLMGSPEDEPGRLKNETRHHVTLTRGFYMAATEVTNAHIKAWDPNLLTKRAFGRFRINAPNQPATIVTWNQANEFCGWLSSRKAARGRLRYRLPTEAEWEWACRGETTTRFFWGDDETKLAEYANAGDPATRDEFWGESRTLEHPPWIDPEDAYPNAPMDDGHRMAAPVGTFKANPYGLFEMIGNVWEFCQDWMRDHSTEATVDPRGPDSERKNNHVMRGGGWRMDWRYCRSAARHPDQPNSGPKQDHGFRLAVDRLDAKPPSRSSSRRTSRQPSRQPASTSTKPWWKPTRAQERYAKNKKVPLTFENSLGMRFVLIPPGTFNMGSPGDEQHRLPREVQHKVKLTKGFYLADAEVTNGQFRAFRPQHHSRALKLRSLNQDEQPAIWVSVDSMKGFCAWLDQQEGRSSHYRLPTEAEWEWACRAETETAFFWGNDPGQAKDFANVATPETLEWYWESKDWIKTPFANDDAHLVSAPARTFRPNRWGLFDMLGNVFEITADRYGDSPKHAVVDPQGPEFGRGFVIRGGAFETGIRNNRSASRGSTDGLKKRPESEGYMSVGFRVALPLEAAPTTADTKKFGWEPSREQKSYARKKKLEVEMLGPLGMRLVLIPPGQFVMGSPPEEEFRFVDGPERQHPVRLTRGFYMATTEVTNAQFRRFIKGPDSNHYGLPLNAADQPVGFVNWEEATKFCEWLTGEHGQGMTYRLPSDAEWEYACRAGTTTAHPWKGALARMHQHANTADQETKRTHPFEVWEQSEFGDEVPEDADIAPGDDGYRFSAPVGQFPPNRWGLHDMIGNVIEWVQDNMRNFTGEEEIDPTETDLQGTFKIIRGGSWRKGNALSRSACRVSFKKTGRQAALGFRVVAEPPGNR